MPRPATARPPGEHVTVLARVMRQVDADTKMHSKRRRIIKTKLTDALNELLKEANK